MAAHNALQLTISSVSHALFDGAVESVILPGVMGEMQILAGHEALISPLKPGTITIKKRDGETEKVAIRRGVLEVSDNHATVLIESENPEAKPE